MDRPRLSCRHRRPGLTLAAVALALLAFTVAAGAATPIRWPDPYDDPLAPILRRIDDYLQLHQADGVSMDWRYQYGVSEEIRQTVVCQLLAYVELARLDPRPRLRAEILRHADYLLPRLADVRSYTPFDGMLAYSLLGAYEITREPRFLDAGSAMMGDLLAIPTSSCVLNGGLMVAMATAEYAKLTGNAQSLQKTRDIVAQLTPYQNPDGSFPHWCPGSRDIHYTGWMGMELVHIGRLVPDLDVDAFLGPMAAFLDARVGLDGRARYEEPCPGIPNCTEYFYSRATGCYYDLDSRGWTVEPAYLALLFDRVGSAKYPLSMSFLESIEHDGVIADLFGYWPPPSDPEYPWTIADTSVVCMSIIEWVLSTAVAERIERGVPVDLVLDDLIDTSAVGPEPPVAYRPRPLVVQPNPARGACVLRFTLADPRAGSLTVYDPGGRRVRTLESGTLARGDHAPRWDGRDEQGRTVAEGVYFARLSLDDGVQTRRLTLLR